MSMDKKPLSLYEIEKEIFRKICEMGCEMLKNMLQSIDGRILAERDGAVYRNKGLRKTAVKTIFGTVEYERTIYCCKDEYGVNHYVFLLDEALGFDKIGFVSEGLTEIITKATAEMPYRKAAEAVSEMTGQSISHMGAWNVTQAVGERLDKNEKAAAERVKNNQNRGKTEVELLFEEQDGVWLNLQGKDREKSGKSKEMKISIAYSGAKKTGKNRYNLVGKVACANFENIEKFYPRKEGVIGETYNLDEIKMRVLNGDGANWIKRSVNGDTIYQLDTFHRNKAITTYVSDKNVRNLLFELLYKKEIDTLIDVIEAYSNSAEDPQEKANFLQLLSYFKNNKDGLISYKRRGLDLPAPPSDDVIFRGCGAMESNVYSIIGKRMKRRRANWSIKGGNNLARILTLKSTGKLSETLRNITTFTLPQKYEEIITKNLSAADIPKSIGKGYSGIKLAHIPNPPTWLKNISAFKPIF